MSKILKLQKLASATTPSVVAISSGSCDSHSCNSEIE
ncbi:class III lanthipeptide [Stackebrandtia albiflava]|nr:class III lanthipeptide [Stackebrandtia albiflava]